MRLIFFTILIFLIGCSNPSPTAKVIIQPGEHLQKLKLHNLTGDETAIEDYLGKPLLINYWATWCQFCKKDFPELQKFKQQHSKSINVICISDENLAIINRYAAKSGLDFTFLMQNGSLSKLGVSQRPTYAYFDASGKHLETINGSVDLSVLNEMINYHKKKKSNN